MIQKMHAVVVCCAITLFLLFVGTFVLHHSCSVHVLLQVCCWCIYLCCKNCFEQCFLELTAFWYSSVYSSLKMN